jgi:stage II sporulation protein D
VLRRGFSPRILTAYVLGSRGRTLVHGPELAARLGLSDSWAYFSVRNGQATTPEPDRSGQPPPASPPASVEPVLPGPQGGAVTPSAAEASAVGGSAAS